MRGLYLITNDDEFTLLRRKLEIAFSSHQVALLQYRRKQTTLQQKLIEIPQLQALCQSYNIPLIINDDLALAQRFSLGVHLGQDDGSIQQARAVLGEQAIIGRTCLNSLQLAKQAIVDGANYIAFGAIYESSSKKTLAKNIGIQIIQQARDIFPHTHICAIGGLSVENALPVINAGADLCAVIGDVLNLRECEILRRVEDWGKLF